MNNLDPEIQAAFIGIVAYVVAWIIGKAISSAKTYIDLKIAKKTDCGTDKGCPGEHCGDHYQLVKSIAVVETDVKWLRKTREEELANGRA